MTCDGFLIQILALYQRQGRMSYRTVERRFAHNDSYLKDMKAELIDAQQVASEEGGKVLAWTG
jgi:hypothetical protein